jgi:ketosteroid isomerase-like protein
MTAPTTPTLDVEALRTAPESTFALAAVLAEDVEWIDVDRRSQPHAPSVLHGREAVLGMIADAESRGIVSRVTDGFASGDRAALTVTCSYAGGGQVLCNALVELRDGNIVRWFGVQAWDD